MGEKPRVFASAERGTGRVRLSYNPTEENWGVTYIEPNISRTQWFRDPLEAHDRYKELAFWLKEMEGEDE